MQKLIQTKICNGGNCLSTCFACLLEMPVEDMPDTESGWNMRAMNDFLASRNLCAIWLSTDLNDKWVGYSPEYCIVIGDSPRLNGSKHAVIGSPNGYGYRIVHDPHPDGGGLKGNVTGVIYLGCANVAQNKSVIEAAIRAATAVKNLKDGDCCWNSRVYGFPRIHNPELPNHDFNRDLETVAMHYAKERGL